MNLDFIGIAFNPDSCFKEKRDNIMWRDLTDLFKGMYLVCSSRSG